MMKTRMIVLGLLVVVSFVLAMPVAADPLPPDRPTGEIQPLDRLKRLFMQRFPRLMGELREVNAQGLVLETRQGNVSVVVDARTRILIPGMDAVQISDLQPDMLAVVLGIKESDAVHALVVVAQMPKPRVKTVQGTVSSVADGALELELGGGRMITATVSESTEVLVPEVGEPTLDDILVGDRVQVWGRVRKGAAIADRIVVIPSETASLVGEVVTVESSIISVKTRLEQVITVQTDATTQVFIPGVVRAALAELRVGDRVRIAGTWQDASNFRAWAVQVARKGRVARVQGRVLSIVEAGFDLASPDGVITVNVDEETVYRSAGDSASFDDLETETWVVVNGLIQEDGQVYAKTVGLRSP